MSSGCFDLILDSVGVGTTFATAYELPGFFLSGIWFKYTGLGDDDVPYGVAIAMATVAFLHVGFLFTPCFNPHLSNLRFPSSAAWFYSYFGPTLRNYWLGTLGLAVGAIVTTGLSGFSVWLLFLHSWFEAWLFAIRIATYLRKTDTLFPIFFPPTVFLVLGLSVMIASDSPIDKAIITLIPAFVSDMGNIIVSSLLFNRSKHEEANSANIDWRYGMDSKDHAYELAFVIMHFIIFYPQLGLACLLTPHDLAILLLTLFAANTLILLLVNIFQQPIQPLSQHKLDPALP